MAYSYDPNLQAWQNYQAWVAAGSPQTDASGMQLDVRGAPMDPNAWSGVYSGIANQGGAAGQAAYASNPTGAVPGYTVPGTSPAPTGNVNPAGATSNGSSTPGVQPGNVAPAGATPGGTTPGSMPMTPYGPGSSIFGSLPNVTPAGYSGSAAPGSYTLPGVQPGNVAPAGATTPGSAPTTLGNLAGGNLSIPGTQPNYPLDIGSYLNPMLGYMLQNGMNTINNSAAAAGSLRSGDTLKQLMQYGMGVSGNAFNNAANIAAGQQAFGYGVDNNDRNFFYNAMVNDRDFNFNKDMGEAGLGLNATNQVNANSRALADIISRNLLLQGQAQAGGTIGGSNAITNAISQLLAQGSGNQSMSVLQQLLAGLGTS
jgi:hypothetical protein